MNIDKTFGKTQLKFDFEIGRQTAIFIALVILAVVLYNNLDSINFFGFTLNESPTIQYIWTSILSILSVLEELLFWFVALAITIITFLLILIVGLLYLGYKFPNNKFLSRFVEIKETIYS